MKKIKKKNDEKVEYFSVNEQLKPEFVCQIENLLMEANEVVTMERFGSIMKETANDIKKERFKN